MHTPKWGAGLFVVLYLLIFPYLLSAQIRHDTLGEVEVLADRVRLSGQFQQLDHIGEDRILRTPALFLSDVLTWNTHWFVLSYGPGMVSTAAHRGNNAEQVRVFWNGIPLNHPALGMLDLSLIPAILFDDISLLNAGASAQMGNGSLGGNIFLANRQASEGLTLRQHTSMGSFGYVQQMSAASYRQGRFSGSTKILWQRSDNDYTFQPLFGEPRPLPNAAYRQMHIMQEAQVELDSRNRLQAALWYLDKQTQIPPTITGNQRQLAGLEDRQAVASLGWHNQRSAENGRLLQYAFVYADQWYTQDFPDIESFNPARSHYVEHHQYGKVLGWRYKLGQQFTYSSSPGPNLSEGNFQRWFGVFGELGNTFFNRWDLEFSARQEWVNGFDPPLAIAFLNRYHFNEHWKMLARVSTNYRIPTLNQLYWAPVGNPDLLPENNLLGELSLEYISTRSQLQLTAYTSYTRNYIQWRPSIGPFWSATNLKEVRAYGLELSHDYLFLQTRNAQLGSNLRGAYGRAFGVGEDDPFAGLQLIYQPIYRYSHSVYWKNQKWDVSLRCRYVSEMFGLLDHHPSAQIPGVWLFGSAIQHSFSVGKGILRASIHLENLTNQMYQLQLGRPMPGFHFFVGLNYDFPT